MSKIMIYFVQSPDGLMFRSEPDLTLKKVRLSS